MKNSKLIALAGVSAALAAVFIMLGSYIPILDLTCFLLAGFALMLPLYKKSVFAALGAYAVGGGLGLIFAGFNFVAIIPFFVWFGLHPILNFLQMKYNINRLIALFVKLFIFNAAIFVILRFTELFLNDFDWLNDNEYLFYILGSLIFIPYDFVMLRLQRNIDTLLYRIIK